MTTPTLSSRLDAARSLDDRMDALAELARLGQLRVTTYFRRRGVSDGDVLADLEGEVWWMMTWLVSIGRYTDRGKEPMAFVYRIAHNILCHYRDRDRRLKGQIITLDESLDLASDGQDQLENIEAMIDQAHRFEQLLDHLDSASDRQVAELCWQEQSAPKIAETLNLNVKTVRASIKRIVTVVRDLRDLD